MPSLAEKNMDPLVVKDSLLSGSPIFSQKDGKTDLLGLVTRRDHSEASALL